MPIPKTYNELYVAVKRVLNSANMEDSALEARELVCAAAEKSKENFYRDMNQYASSETEARVLELLRRRLTGEPLAYLTGEWDFMGTKIIVTPDVLVPRNDTEILAYAATQAAKGMDGNARVLDLCTGSGCIGVTVALNARGSRVVLVDSSPEALKVAKLNVRANGLSYFVSCVELDALATPPGMIGEYDIIVSNPPYIPHDEIQNLEVSVRDFEPHSALDGGDDGLKFYRAITEKWSCVLRPGGWLMYELGEGQAREVQRIMRDSGYQNINVFKDAGGTERVIIGQKQ